MRVFAGIFAMCVAVALVGCGGDEGGGSGSGKGTADKAAAEKKAADKKAADDKAAADKKAADKKGGSDVIPDAAPKKGPDDKDK